jgi:hypothetical protein
MAAVNSAVGTDPYGITHPSEQVACCNDIWSGDELVQKRCSEQSLAPGGVLP